METLMTEEKKMETLMTNEQFNMAVTGIKIIPRVQNREMAFEGAFNVNDALIQLKTYWEIARPVLNVVKIITPRKINKAIKELTAVVDKLCSNPSEEDKSELLEKFALVWGSVKPILVSAKAITGPKADKIIDDFNQIGDMMATS